ncbi:MAG: LLM class flavin-dependent oxidoreductase [Gammaproteobacteria bacterium]|jgi:5,10-methylenetetrahydromethanopterin reductase|nr:LLM class flavin-dependent oxidoreductase [Gammaproteobacteria bacterium]
MDLGVCVASHIRDIDYIVRAETLGYSHAWLADSQMLWSDCYATLALAADRTSRIKLGTGVAVSGTRPASVNASSIATINAIAPGRTFFGVGAGNTARRVMGLPPQRIQAFEYYLQELVPLLKGEEAHMRWADQTIPIRHVMPDKGFVNFDDPIPLYVSGFGPRSLALAGQYGDGAVLALPGNPAAMASLWHMIQTGARAADRSLSTQGDYYTTALTTMVVLDDDEDADSDRVKNECGAMALAAVHYAYDQYRNFGHQPPHALAGIWDEYTRLLDSYPEERRHQRIHAGHNCWVLPEEEKFLTPEVLQASCMIGSKSALIEQLRALEAAGLQQVMILPNFDTRHDVLARVANDIIPNV